MRKILRRGLCLFILALFSCSVLSVCVYADTYSEWAQPELMAANYSDITIYKTYGENMDFTQSITRRDFSYLASKLITRSKNMVWDFYKNDASHGLNELKTPFSDVKFLKAEGSTDAGYFDNEYDKGIGILYKEGIISGIDDTHFAPDEFITREQAAKILTLLIANITYSEPINYGNDVAHLKDGAIVSEWARQYVWFVMNEGIMNGTGDNCFNPQGNITYEQAVSICYRIAKKYNLKGIVELDVTNKLHELQLYSICGACWDDNYAVYYPINDSAVSSVKVLSAKINGNGGIATVEKIDVEALEEEDDTFNAADYPNAYRINSSVQFENVVFFELELEVTKNDGTIEMVKDCFTWEVTGLGGVL